jgi:hypothetical protein
MATLYVRDVPERTYRRVRKLAAAQGQTLGELVVEVLEDRLDNEARCRRAARALESIRRRRVTLPADMPDSVAVLRQIRAGRG